MNQPHSISASDAFCSDPVKPTWPNCLTFHVGFNLDFLAWNFVWQISMGACVVLSAIGNGRLWGTSFFIWIEYVLWNTGAENYCWYASNWQFIILGIRHIMHHCRWWRKGENKKGCQVGIGCPNHRPSEAGVGQWTANPQQVSVSDFEICSISVQPRIWILPRCGATWKS